MTMTAAELVKIVRPVWHGQLRSSATSDSTPCGLWVVHCARRHWHPALRWSLPIVVGRRT